MVYNFTSVKRVISKVFTDLDLKEGDHRIVDMIEWAGEAVKKIGGFPTLITRVAGKGGFPALVIENYQAKLPSDIVTVNQVAFSTTENGPFIAMTYAAGSFDAGIPFDKVSTTTSGDVVYPESELVRVAMELYSESYVDATARLNGDAALKDFISGFMGNGAGTPTRDMGSLSNTYTYVITPGYIKTNAKTGYLMISYQAVPVDEDGFPMIPDDESFEEAIYWYINMKLTYPAWKEGRVRDAVYFDTRSSWNFYRKQAYANVLMPNVDQLESIKNAWVRLVPEIDEHSTFFAGLNNRQIIYNQNK